MTYAPSTALIPLIGVFLWGNNGEGVTIVCPSVTGYAEDIAEPGPIRGATIEVGSTLLP
ncbi:MAG: hypothetical protein OQK97_00810 [Deltaproteobacteria bacterium]|jgi:hypothetical protein|nr:hypothetical protein [Deltaproteobacteria bacterium]MCW8893477.1 hypothetical protein [Deltaproteobacteria bacterium]